MKTRDKLNIKTFYPEFLKVTNVTEYENQIRISLKSMKHIDICPKCNKEMGCYHGTYTRTVQDLPILGKMVSLTITAFAVIWVSRPAVQQLSGC